MITKAAEEVIGFSGRVHQDWFDQNDAEIAQLIEQKRSARLAWESHQTRARLLSFHKAKQECQRRLREIQNVWWRNKAEEIQLLADKRDLRRFYAATKEIFGPRRIGGNTLLSSDGLTTFTDDLGILKRWQEHFHALLNRPSTVADDLLRNVPQHPTRLWMSAPPSYQEFGKALKAMKAWKAPGPDNIPLELLTHGGLPVKTRLFTLIQRMWETKTVPTDLKDANIVTIFKKGDQSICGNYRGIFLLSIAGKVFARILLERLLKVSEEVLPESQCGFRPSRGTTDMIFCARLLQEKSREHRKPLLFVFWDLEKAFDSVPRPAMWATLRRFGCPERFTDLIQALHDGMSGRVIAKNVLSDPFPVTTGLKQGCVLAPTLFSLYLGAMIHELPDAATGIEIRHRMDGGLFNTARFRSRRLTTLTNVRELQYADDNATPEHTVAGLKEAVDLFDAAYSRFGLTTNVRKTKILAQRAPGLPAPDTSDVRLHGDVLETVDAFPYLGSYLSSDCSIQRDVDNRIRAAHATFGKLKKRVFLNHDLKLQTKIMVFRAVILSTLLYGSETWVLYRRDVRKLERFQQHKLRAILKIGWQDFVTNEEVLIRAGLPSIEATVTHHRLRWSGHVRRMAPSRLPRQLLFAELASGTRSRGGPKRRYRDQLKSSLLRCAIDPDSWETLAEDRQRWRRAVREGSSRLEADRRREAEDRRQRRKERLLLPRPAPTLQCDHCQRLFHTTLGLGSHIHHRHPPSPS